MQVQPTQPNADQGPVYGPENNDQSAIRRIEIEKDPETERAAAVRSELINLLGKIDTEEMAGIAVHQAAMAIEDGNLTRDQFGEMVQDSTGTAQSYILTNEEALTILPKDEVEGHAGTDEYSVDYLRHNSDRTEAELNAMPELPKDKKVDEAPRNMDRAA